MLCRWLSSYGYIRSKCTGKAAAFRKLNQLGNPRGPFFFGNHIVTDCAPKSLTEIIYFISNIELANNRIAGIDNYFSQTCLDKIGP